ncbi:MAG: prepilin-type N-terminal cleavage/methylation domain-containing protein [Proteobacteria bacterium]|nr:prepilin-type N-terminal cleavage/methylation domain-containing protein [Pseudomonadota bacterium]MBU1716389.1 prepilin-type N-terminal cleavage/methylation domain-containing protein [Pseudomonadota bacterium]
MKIKANLNNKGFTLIEVLIAVAVVTIAVLGVAVMQISSIGGNANALNLTEATTLALAQAEVLFSLEYPDPGIVPDPARPRMLLSNYNDQFYQRMDYEAVGLTQILLGGVPAVADNLLVSDGYQIFWDVAPIMSGVPLMEVALDIRVDVVWNENNRLKTVTVNFVKSRF